MAGWMGGGAYGDDHRVRAEVLQKGPVYLRVQQQRSAGLLQLIGIGIAQVEKAGLMLVIPGELQHAAQTVRLLGQRDAVAPLGGGHRRLKARRAAADHQHLLFPRRRRCAGQRHGASELRVDGAARRGRGRVLRGETGVLFHVLDGPGKAAEAPQAFEDLPLPALHDLVGELDVGEQFPAEGNVVRLSGGEDGPRRCPGR